ncbi:hypothetical protein HAX54_040854 [Datura stramonium]|uniref:RecQ mediated genome instability protein 1 OB-fold domain-containing protein n=1 Tax=Datura stramonium TaxID=4076 RepID=A0ABS8SKM5_DATST|nr:hypothetical protein [Datura stramonium]
MENPYSSSSSSSSENLLSNLNTRGWCFRDVNLVNSLIESQLPSPYTVDSTNRALNMDLRSIGGKLPDFSLLRKSTHLQGPKVLQSTSYSSIPDDVVPGTKVRLENKATVHSGIVCLNAKMITVLGGAVSSLYEEWQMNKKYSGFSRSTLKVAHEDGTAGPPPFEKLQIGALHKHLSQNKRYSEKA